MEDIRKRVFLELLISPWSVFPTAGGISILMLSWALNVWGSFSFLGIVGILIGIGAAITNCTFNFTRITVKAAEELRARELQKQEEQLDQLDAKLVKDRDPRDQGYLRELRSLYRDFITDMRDKRLTVSPEMVMRVEEIFKTCVASLEDGYNLWEASQKLSGTARDRLLKKREKILEEVGASVGLLGHTLVDIRDLNLTNPKLAKQRDDLAIQLEAARRTRERLAELDGDSERDFSEYE